MNRSIFYKIIVVSCLTTLTDSIVLSQSYTYPIVGSNQTISYDTVRIIPKPFPGQPYYGQNSNYPGNVASYTNNGNGTVTDNITGLMWQQTEDRNGDGVINFYDKLTYADAVDGAAKCKTGGYHDWRLPTIKELYSLVMSSGTDINQQSPSTAVPYINSNYFGFGYGDTNSLAHGDLANERIIDAQVATSTLYVSTTMNGVTCMFGYNFSDGRIKAYPTTYPVPEDGQTKRYYVLYVRGNSNYGQNNFHDNGDSTITDNATGLMWAKYDSQKGMKWESALEWAQTKNHTNYCGHNDWRLPDVKELQSIVDYTRFPATTNSAAINQMFSCTKITNEGGNADFPWYWSSTTFCEGDTLNGGSACYVCFGSAMGYFSGLGWTDVHGAGAQRSDPKGGSLSPFTHFGNGYYNPQAPQGDAVRINNYVRLVRNVTTTGINELNPDKSGGEFRIYPNPVNQSSAICYQLSENTQVNISIYDITGSKVGTLIDEEKVQGDYSLNYNAEGLKSGIYFVKFSSNDGVRVARLLKN